MLYCEQTFSSLAVFFLFCNNLSRIQKIIIIIIKHLALRYNASITDNLESYAVILDAWSGPLKYQYNQVKIFIIHETVANATCSCTYLEVFLSDIHTKIKYCFPFPSIQSGDKNYWSQRNPSADFNGISFNTFKTAWIFCSNV